MKNLEQIGNNLLPAIAYGDAAGLPVETKSRKHIHEKFGRIDRLVSVQENPFYVGEFDRGTWSDDTQLSLAVAHSLIKTRGFDLRSMADEHVAAYNQTPQITRPDGQAVKRGWGGSTTNSVERYMATGDPETCGEKEGMGNGVIMKMAPLAFWLIAREYDRSVAYDISDEFTSLTHDNDISRVSSRVHLDALWHLTESDYERMSFAEAVMSSAVRHETKLGESSRANSTALNYLTRGVDGVEDIMKNTDGKGFYVPQTLAMAYGAFMVHDGHFAGSVYEAVNLGGDTDSTASIAATMANLKSGGAFEIPGDFEDTLDHEQLREVSGQFTRLVLENK